MQCGSRDIITATRGTSSEKVSCVCMPKRDASSSNAARDVAARDREAVEPELDALEEDAFLDVGVLIGVHDVAAVAEDELRDRRHEPRLVRAREQQRRSRAHLLILLAQAS